MRHKNGHGMIEIGYVSLTFLEHYSFLLVILWVIKQDFKIQ